MKYVKRNNTIMQKVCDCGALLVDTSIIHYFNTKTNCCELCGSNHKGLKTKWKVEE